MGFEPHQLPSRVEAVNKFTNRMKNALEEAKSVLAKAKDDMARYYIRKKEFGLGASQGSLDALRSLRAVRDPKH